MPGGIPSENTKYPDMTHQLDRWVELIFNSGGLAKPYLLGGRKSPPAQRHIQARRRDGYRGQAVAASRLLAHGGGQVHCRVHEEPGLLRP